MGRIVLASASPRRFELLKQVGLKFDIYPSDITENIEPGIKATEAVTQLALQKASSVAKILEPDTLIIGADTVVVKNEILGKPKDKKEAFSMLKALQGEWHEVITGVALIYTGDTKCSCSYEITRVKMRNLSDDTIRSYIETGEPMDKAGAYGIQGIGAVLVEKIEGCYFNVVGLPLTRLSLMLEKFGYKVL